MSEWRTPSKSSSTLAHQFRAIKISSGMITIWRWIFWSCFLLIVLSWIAEALWPAGWWDGAQDVVSVVGIIAIASILNERIGRLEKSMELTLDTLADVIEEAEAGSK